MTLLLRVWRGVTSLAPSVVLRPVLRAHARQGADPARLCERQGQPTLLRPDGELIWVHAASVGEFIAVRDLVADLVAARHGTSILVTTTTQTGAAAVARSALPRTCHQFLPADIPEAVDRFLDHWRPAMAVFVEGDLWPNLLAGLDRRGTPRALVNARPSRTRARLRHSMAALLRRFEVITAQDADVAQGLIAMGLSPARVAAVGDLKADAAPLVDDPTLRTTLTNAIGLRPLWSAVSTHPADEDPVLSAHAALRQTRPDALLLLVPRHPDRAEAICNACAAKGLSVARRSKGQRPNAATAVYLADTIGETGTFFRLSQIVFLGGSFGQEGGHNPFEPLRLGAALLHGPRVHHFSRVFATLDAQGAASRVVDGPALGQAVAEWLADPVALDRAVAAGAQAMADMGGARAQTLARLLALIDDAA